MKKALNPAKNTWSELLKRPTQTVADIEAVVNDIFFIRFFAGAIHHPVPGMGRCIQRRSDNCMDVSLIRQPFDGTGCLIAAAALIRGPLGHSTRVNSGSKCCC